MLSSTCYKWFRQKKIYKYTHVHTERKVENAVGIMSITDEYR